MRAPPHLMVIIHRSQARGIKRSSAYTTNRRPKSPRKTEKQEGMKRMRYLPLQVRTSLREKRCQIRTLSQTWITTRMKSMSLKKPATLEGIEMSMTHMRLIDKTATYSINRGIFIRASGRKMNYLHLSPLAGLINPQSHSF